MNNNKIIIVISAVNIIEGGALTILRECLESVSKWKNDSYKIIAIVHDKNLCNFDNIEYIEIPWAKRNWLNRLYCEYHYLKNTDKEIKSDIWLSLHDTTPNINAKTRAVYCHNPSPFYKPRLSDIKYNIKEYLFSKFYKYLYQINIQKNSFIIVQQEWLRNEFSRLFKIKAKKIIVAPPKQKTHTTQILKEHKIDSNIKTFFFPAFPRTFKNFEDICEACKILSSKGVHNYCVILTIDGSENIYANDIRQKYSQIDEITFNGLMKPEEVYETYSQSDCLLFPSKLETWGLPISEFIQFNKPMIIADLPYAHETSNGGKQVAFYKVSTPQHLANLMLSVINGNLEDFLPNIQQKLEPPTASNWEEVFNLLLEKYNQIS